MFFLYIVTTKSAEIRSLAARFPVLHLQQWLFGLRLADAFGGSSCDAVHSLQRLRLGAGNVVTGDSGESTW